MFNSKQANLCRQQLLDNIIDLSRQGKLTYSSARIAINSAFESMENGNTTVVDKNERYEARAKVQDLVDKPFIRDRITLKGKRARIVGFANEFATVRQINDIGSCEYAWETVLSILENADGKFQG